MPTDPTAVPDSRIDLLGRRLTELGLTVRRVGTEPVLVVGPDDATCTVALRPVGVAVVAVPAAAGSTEITMGDEAAANFLGALFHERARTGATLAAAAAEVRARMEALERIRTPPGELGRGERPLVEPAEHRFLNDYSFWLGLGAAFGVGALVAEATRRGWLILGAGVAAFLVVEILIIWYLERCAIGCPRCGGRMTVSYRTSGAVLTSSYWCRACGKSC